MECTGFLFAEISSYLLPAYLELAMYVLREVCLVFNKVSSVSPFLWFLWVGFSQHSWALVPFPTDFPVCGIQTTFRLDQVNLLNSWEWQFGLFFSFPLHPGPMWGSDWTDVSALQSQPCPVMACFKTEAMEPIWFLWLHHIVQYQSSADSVVLFNWLEAWAEKRVITDLPISRNSDKVFLSFLPLRLRHWWGERESIFPCSSLIPNMPANQ